MPIGREEEGHIAQVHKIGAIGFSTSMLLFFLVTGVGVLLIWGACSRRNSLVGCEL